MERVPCFFLTPTGEARVDLRRFSPTSTRPCTVKGAWGCDATTKGVATVALDGRPPRDADDAERYPHDDPRYPTHCEACKQPFAPTDSYQVREEALYARSDGGEPTTLKEAPIGAMWDAEWLHDLTGSFHVGEDGYCLTVRLPNGHHWTIDSRASNCTLREDNVHRCWVRHGKAPDITVDKNGHTCGAGAGSILAGDYHGFLRGGYLEAC